MTKNFLFFIPFHNPWDWHTDYANQTAALLAQHHTVVCFLWGDAVSLREIMAGAAPYRPIRRTGRLFMYQPLYLLPGKRALPIQFINLFLNLIVAYLICSLMVILHRKTLLFWFFGIYDPAFLLLPVFFRYTRTVYDCVDTPSHPDAAMTLRLKQSEAIVLRHAWIVTANSKTLQERLCRARQDVHLVPLGFRHEIFRHFAPHTLPFSRKKPVIGYIGAIDYRIDFPMLYRLITGNSHWQFALVGPVFYDHMQPKMKHLMQKILTLPNVYHTKVTAKTIPDILAQCHVTIIPYRDTLAFNRKSFPMKTMEYLYAGKPVVASYIDELAAYHPFIRFAHTHNEWKRMIKGFIDKPLNLREKRQAKSIASSHTWNKKVQTLLNLLHTTPEPH